MGDKRVMSPSNINMIGLIGSGGEIVTGCAHLARKDMHIPLVPIVHNKQVTQPRSDVTFDCLSVSSHAAHADGLDDDDLFSAIRPIKTEHPYFHKPK